MASMKEAPGRASQAANAQDQMLMLAHASRMPLQVYLVNGLRLRGIVLSVDRHVVLMSSTRPGSDCQLVYKGSIASVVPYDDQEAPR